MTLGGAVLLSGARGPDAPAQILLAAVCVNPLFDPVMGEARASGGHGVTDRLRPAAAR